MIPLASLRFKFKPYQSLSTLLSFGKHLFSSGVDSVPDAVQLAPDYVVKIPEDAFLEGELGCVDFIGLPELLDANVHQLCDGVVDLRHGGAHEDFKFRDLCPPSTFKRSLLKTSEACSRGGR